MESIIFWPQNTLKCGIVVHVRLSIFDKFAYLYDLIPYCMFIDFGVLHNENSDGLMLLDKIVFIWGWGAVFLKIGCSACMFTLLE